MLLSLVRASEAIPCDIVRFDNSVKYLSMHDHDNVIDELINILNIRAYVEIRGVINKQFIF